MKNTRPPSPCVKVCQLNAAQTMCIGCMRSLDEIGAWSRMSDTEKWALLAELRERQARAA